MCNTIIGFVVAKGYNIRCNCVHNFDGAQTFEFTVNYRPAEHIPCNTVKGVCFFTSYLVYISRQHTYAANKVCIYIHCGEIPVHIVGMQKCKFFVSAHNLSPFRVLFFDE